MYPEVHGCSPTEPEEFFGMTTQLQKHFRPRIEVLDDRITPAPVARQANFGNLVSALNNVAVQLENVQVLSNIGNLEVVHVSDVLNGNNVQALNNALNRNAVDIALLQNFLNNSVNNNNVEVLKNFLNNSNVNIQDLVAINVLSGGDITVFSM